MNPVRKFQFNSMPNSWKLQNLKFATLNSPVLRSEIWDKPFGTWNVVFVDIAFRFYVRTNVSMETDMMKNMAFWLHVGRGDANYGIIRHWKVTQKNVLKVYMDCPHIKHPCSGIMKNVTSVFFFFSQCFSPLTSTSKTWYSGWKGQSKSTITTWQAGMNYKPGALAIVPTMPT